MSDTSFNVGLGLPPVAPKYRLLQQQPTGGTAPGVNYAQDNYAGNPTGGAGPDDAALIAQTDQMINSPDLSQRYQAIINMTKMSPQNALPRLQQVINTPGQDPNVVNLAQRAMAALQQMPQQPAANMPQQPQQQYPQQQPAQQQPQGQPFQQQPVQQQPAYVPAQMGPLSPQDAAFMLQTLQTDLSDTGQKGIQAIQQVAAIAQAHPALKEQCYNLLLNHLYTTRGLSTLEAVKALGSMNNPALVPYLQMVQRDSGYPPATRELAVQMIKSMSTQPAGPGVASAGGAATSPEYLRAMEHELGGGGARGMNAFAQIRNALGQDPRAQSAARPEVLRILLTHIATKTDGATVQAACQLLGQMGTREMDTLRYLDAVTRNSNQAPYVQEAAKAAIRQIMSAPAAR